MLPRLQSVKHEVCHRQLDHRDAAFGLRLVILTQPAVSAQPAEGAFDNPAFGQHLEALHIVAALHNLDLTAQTPRGLREVLTAEPAVGPEFFESVIQALDLDEHLLAAVTLGRVGPGDDAAEDQPECIDDQETLSAKGFLARVIAVATVLEGASVLTLWLSITPAEGVGFLPTPRRTFSRSLL